MNLDYILIFAVFVDLCKSAIPIAVFLHFSTFFYILSVFL